MSNSYDVIVVGAGPAGIFAALELSRLWKGAGILMLEKGPELSRRHCPMRTQGSRCLGCTPCMTLSGWGGAGAFSDGKLALSPRVGGFLGEYVGEAEAMRLIRDVHDIYLHFGAPDRLFGTDDGRIRDLARRAATVGLDLVHAPIRHLGTENCPRVLRAMREELDGRVEIRTCTPVEELLVEDGAVVGVRTADTEYRARYVVAAPGRNGSEWFTNQARRLGLELENNPVDVGVRVEVPALLLDHLTDVVYEPKLLYHSRSFDDLVRTFCVCPRGEVVLENNSGVITVNGHSYADRPTENTNFAVLVSKTFTEPFKEPIAYGKYVASLANMLGGKVIVQRLGDLTQGRRSTEERLAKSMVRPTLAEATPGDLSLVLPYRHLINILEMLEALGELAPGVNSRSTLLYGVEAKFYSSRVKVTPSLETQVHNLFVAGDGAGITRGLAQASASGLHVAREIMRREGILRGKGGG